MSSADEPLPEADHQLERTNTMGMSKGERDELRRAGAER